MSGAAGACPPSGTPATSLPWRDVRFRSPDGLELYARDYGPSESASTPVLCLSGLTRNSRDAQPLAEQIASDRRVIAPDYRGRGRSAYAPDWSSYTVEVELADAIALLDRLGVGKVVLIGTSRGGLIAMLMAALHRDRLAGVLLNDIGPVLEPAGLLRIRQYLGRPLRFTTWRGAVAALKRINPGLESLSEAEWLAFARRVYRDEGGRPVLDYDPNLRRSFPTPAKIAAGAVPPMWELMAPLEGLPVATLRGEHSDLLSPQTLARMAENVPGLDAVTVANRGHAPFLDESESRAGVARLLARCA
ncbi:MAG TPA: alpha/beta hydrolase [Aestuariivirgaceae bacterium]|nr:alpha/beta hydrolase [Aestuariivirgaceae bacterium]